MRKEIEKFVKLIKLNNDRNLKRHPGVMTMRKQDLTHKTSSPEKL